MKGIWLQMPKEPFTLSGPTGHHNHHHQVESIYF